MTATHDFNYVYGYGDIVRYTYNDRYYRRIDRYTPVDGSPPVLESHACVDRSDRSPIHDSWIGRGYDSRCSCCYLNISHTQNRHNQSIAEVVARESDRSPSDHLSRTVAEERSFSMNGNL